MLTGIDLTADMEDDIDVRTKDWGLARLKLIIA